MMPPSVAENSEILRKKWSETNSRTTVYAHCIYICQEINSEIGEPTVG